MNNAKLGRSPEQQHYGGYMPRLPIIGVTARTLQAGLYFCPAPYSGPPSVPVTVHDPERNLASLPLLRAVVVAGIPVLALYRGFQEMNVAFGGGLHRNVHEVGRYIDHGERGNTPPRSSTGQPTVN